MVDGCHAALRKERCESFFEIGSHRQRARLYENRSAYGVKSTFAEMSVSS
jgi:hypothetical protein